GRAADDHHRDPPDLQRPQTAPKPSGASAKSQTACAARRRKSPGCSRTPSPSCSPSKHSPRTTHRKPPSTNPLERNEPQEQQPLRRRRACFPTTALSRFAGREVAPRDPTLVVVFDKDR